VQGHGVTDGGRHSEMSPRVIKGEVRARAKQRDGEDEWSASKLANRSSAPTPPIVLQSRGELPVERPRAAPQNGSGSRRWIAKGAALL